MVKTQKSFKINNDLIDRIEPLIGEEKPFASWSDFLNTVIIEWFAIRDGKSRLKDDIMEVVLSDPMLRDAIIKKIQDIVAERFKT